MRVCVCVFSLLSVHFVRPYHPMQISECLLNVACSVNNLPQEQGGRNVGDTIGSGLLLGSSRTAIAACRGEVVTGCLAVDVACGEIAVAGCWERAADVVCG